MMNLGGNRIGDWTPDQLTSFIQSQITDQAHHESQSALADKVPIPSPPPLYNGDSIVWMNGNWQMGGNPPTGAVQMYLGTTAPTGYLMLDGSAVSRSTYSRLFALCGTTFGAGDGSTTFNLPDCRGRAIIGVGTGSGLTARALAATGGEETHVLATTEIPSHSHGGTTGSTTATGITNNATPSLPIAGTAGTANNPGSGGFTGAQYTNTVTAGATAYNGTATLHGHVLQIDPHTHTIPAEGSGLGHNNMQPFLALNFIVKT